tara:strand:- start:2167 stop:2595 length:429 start_codon:yes stop_codon:yes gene_type:complete
MSTIYKRSSLNKRGNRLGGIINDGLTMTPQQRAVAAAEKRSKDSVCRKKEVKNRMDCDNLIGRIEAIYAGKNKDPPFGLRAASLWALKKYLKKALKPMKVYKDIIIKVENENCHRNSNFVKKVHSNNKMFGGKSNNMKIPKM